MQSKRVIVSVTNDLVTDQRVNKSCLTLQKVGFDVVLVGRKLPNSPSMDKRTYACHRMKLIFKKGALFYAEYNIRLFFYLLFHRANCFLSNDLDTLLPNYLVAKIKGIQLIYDSHEYFTEVPELVNRPKVQNIWKKIEEYVLPKLDEMITVNESIADLFRKKYGIEVNVIRNIPMRGNLPNIASKEKLGLPRDKYLLLLQGSGINIHRGSEELLEAMEYLENCHLVIIGSGDVVPILKQTVKTKGWEDRVTFFSRMPYQQMMAITQLADLGFTLDKNNNINYRFSLPNKLFDYIQANVPIVSSHLVEIERIITEYNIGTFIENHQVETIVQTINQVLNDKKCLADWKNNLKVAAQELCWENEEKKLITIYKRYIS